MITEPTTLCIACNYSLAGLSREGNCPECAYPIRLTVEGVENIPIDTLHMMARGSTALFWSTVFCALSPLTLFEPATAGSWLAAGSIAAIVGVLAPMGAWAITPNLRNRAHPVPHALRFAVRLATLSLPLAVLGTIMLSQFAMLLIALAAAFAAVLSLTLYTKSLGRSLGSDDVAGAAGAVLWCIAATVAVLTLSYLGTLAGASVIACFSLAAAIPAVLSLILSLFMFAVLTSTLRDRAGLAKWHANKAISA